MPSIRDIKKDLKYAFETLIEEVLLLQAAGGGDDKKNNALIKEMMDAYEVFIQKINGHKKESDKKAYFKQLNREIQSKIDEFQAKISEL